MMCANCVNLRHRCFYWWCDDNGSNKFFLHKTLLQSALGSRFPPPLLCLPGLSGGKHPMNGPVTKQLGDWWFRVIRSGVRENMSSMMSILGGHSTQRLSFP